MDKYTIIENEVQWGDWAYKNYPEVWMVMQNEPTKYPCLVKEAGTNHYSDTFEVFVSITYLEEAQSLIAHYWDKKEANNYPDSEGFELQNDCNN